MNRSTPHPNFKLSAEQEQLLTLLLEQEGLQRKQVTALKPRHNQHEYPLSFAQKRLWFLDQMSPANPLYTIPFVLRLIGEVDLNHLAHCMTTIVTRHEVLRATFVTVDGEPVQRILPVQPITIPLTDLQSLPSSDRIPAQARLMTEAVAQPFDLTQGPLWRVCLWRMSPEEHLLMVTFHHMVADGISREIFLQELTTLYTAYTCGQTPYLPDLPFQFADFADWQQQWLQGDTLEQQLTFWRQHLAGAPTILELPTDFTRPAIQRHCGDQEYVTLAPKLTESLRSFSRQHGVTLFATLFTAFNMLLARYTQQYDLIVGTPVANRNRPGLDTLIGLFINTLALRADLTGNPTFVTAVTQLGNAILQAYEHQELPFEHIVEVLQPERSMSHTPLFQVMFNLSPTVEDAVELPGLLLYPMDPPSGIAKFDLMLTINEVSDNTLRLALEYDTDLFHTATITRMLTHYQMLLERFVAAPNQSVGAVSLLSASEERQLLLDWNNNRPDYPRHTCIHTLFEEQVARTPWATAVVYEDQPLTYQELNRRANQVASYLQTLGVGPESYVGLYMERSLDLIIGMLGILKAGGTYVPLETTYPQERLSLLLADTALTVILTQTALVESLPTPCSAQLICVDANWDTIAQYNDHNLPLSVAADHLAYIMYTSGSTGTPKGICIPHRGVVRLVKENTFADLSAHTCFLQLAPTAFDLSTLEIWGSLLNGGRLVVFPGTLPLPDKLEHVIAHHQVNTLWLTAGLFHQIVAEHLDILTPLKQLLAGGDVLNPLAVQKVVQELPHCRMINGYGPTENTTFTSCYTVTSPEQVGASVSIGTPIANTQVYVLDVYLQLVPVGVVGELYTGGDGLARGYLHRPDLTAQTFIPHPFSNDPGARLYKTGDLARYRPDGTLEFLGRNDFQVKIRGFRIELGEIETILSHHPAVAKVIVITRLRETAHAASDQELVAYIIPKTDSSLKESDLRAFLSNSLPAYMIPAAFVILERFPLTPNGKVDRRALPVPQRQSADVTAPHTPTEAAIANIWSEILQHEPIGIHDNFFELGGHSLLIMRVLARIQEVFQVHLPLHAFFETPTVAHIAQLVTNQDYALHHMPNIQRVDRSTDQDLVDQLAYLTPAEIDALLDELDQTEV